MENRISGYTTLIGLLATPIKHTSSPKMHNEAFRHLGLDYAYLAFEVGNDGLEDAVKGLKAMQARGCNVSMPNKTVIHKYLDKLTPAAELAGAVNTVINDDGVLTGHITDGVGYMRSLKDAGFDVNIIGIKRIDSASLRWWKAYNDKGILGLEDTRTLNSGRTLNRELTIEEIIAKKDAEIAYLKAELELIKKLELQERQVINKKIHI